MTIPQHIIAATDLSPASDSALGYAASLAAALGARLTAVVALETPYPYPVPLPPERLNGARLELQRKCESLSPRPRDVLAVVRDGRPCQEILSLVQETGADLVVAGTHGRGGLSRFLLGSVAEELVRLSPVPVIIVPSLAADRSQEQRTPDRYG